MANHLQTLANYLPAMLIRRANESHLPIEEAETKKFPAAVMRVDVTGFSQLSEGLTTSAANEKLVEMLNGYFGKVINIIFKHNGDVVKFDHRTVLAMWMPSNEEKGDVATTILRAGKCALHLVRVIGPHEPVPGVRVAIRVGLGVGQVQMMIVGGEENRWEPVLMGAPLDQAEECVADAPEGDVLITREAWGLIRFRSVGDRAGQNTASLEGIKGTLPKLDLPYPVPNSRSQAPMWSFTPGAIRKHIAGKDPKPPRDRRPITVVMTHIPGIDSASELDTAQEAMAAMQAALYEEEGSVVQLYYEYGGLTLCAAFGLPPVEHDDDGVRGVRAAMGISRALERLGLEHSVGVASGTASCASIGHPRRRTYTIIGNVRNVAAALMYQQDGVLCDMSTRTVCGPEIDFEVRAPIDVFGRETPVHRPIMAGEGIKKLPLVGRDDEQRILADSLKSLLRGQNSTVVITGDAGIGKSRLLDELESLAVAENLFPLRGQGDPVERTRPYHAWSDVLAKALGFNDPDWTEVTEDDILRRIAASDRAVELAPLLSDVLPIDIPPNPATVDLTGNSRAQAMYELVLSIMRMYTQGRPTLVVLDDAQWLDAESWGLVEAVWRQVSPLILAIAVREGEEAPTLSAIRRGQHTSVIPLRPMSPEAIVEMARAKFGELPDVVVELLTHKSQGHPLYTDQIAALLVQVGDLDHTAKGLVQRRQLDANAIPDDTVEVIRLRLQLLEPGPLHLIQVASAIGRSFDFLTLHEVLGEDYDMEKLASELNTLRELELTPVIRTDPDEIYAFKHILVQDTAYGEMSQAERAKVHRSIANWYEEEHADHLDSGAHPRLVMHWRIAGEPAKAAKYISHAADYAMHTGAWEEARRLLQEVLDDKAIKVPEHTRARWQRQAGETSLRIGDLDTASKFVTAALDTLGVAAPSAGFAAKRSMWWQSIVSASHKVYVSKAEGDDRAKTLETTRADLLLGEIAQRKGDLETAQLHTVRAMNSGERIGPSPELALAYGQMAAVHQALGKNSDAEHYAEKAIEIANKTEEQDPLAQLFRQLGAYFVTSGDWEKTVTALERALVIGDRTGDRQLAAEARAINASSLHYRGEFGAAMKDFDLVSREADAIGHLQLQIDGLCGSAESMMRRGHLGEALGFLQQAKNMLDDRVSPQTAGRIAALEVALHIRRNDIYTAVPVANEAMRIFAERRPTTYAFLETYGALGECYLRSLEESEGVSETEMERREEGAEAILDWFEAYAEVVPIARPRALMLRGWYLWLEEEEDAAVEKFDEAIEAAENQELPIEQALAMLEMGRRLGFLDRDGRQALIDAERIFADFDARYDRERANRIMAEA